MRKLVLGDIHGSLNSLKQVLNRCKFDNSIDQLIVLGDYCDRWDYSYEVIDLLIKLQLESNNRHIFIKGNHDIWIIDWLNNNNIDKVWLMNGGEECIKSYKRNNFENIETHKKFFNNLKDYFIDEDNNAFVHAGYQSLNGLDDDLYYQDFFWDRRFWNTCVSSNSKPKILNIYNKVFIGHTPTLNFKCKSHLPESKYINVGSNISIPMVRHNVYNMDTGCGYNIGKLSIMDINTEEYWQSDESGIIN